MSPTPADDGFPVTMNGDWPVMKVSLVVSKDGEEETRFETSGGSMVLPLVFRVVNSAVSFYGAEVELIREAMKVISSAITSASGELRAAFGNTRTSSSVQLTDTSGKSRG